MGWWDESQETRNRFTADYGANAQAQWEAEHAAAVGSGYGAPAVVPQSVPLSGYGGGGGYTVAGGGQGLDTASQMAMLLAQLAQQMQLQWPGVTGTYTRYNTIHGPKTLDSMRAELVEASGDMDKWREAPAHQIIREYGAVTGQPVQEEEVPTFANQQWQASQTGFMPGANGSQGSPTMAYQQLMAALTGKTLAGDDTFAARQWNDQLRQFEQNFGLQEGALTGMYNGQKTLAAQQWEDQFGLQQADRTGYYNGQNTLARDQLMASMSGPKDWIKYAALNAGPGFGAMQSTPSWEQDLLASRGLLGQGAGIGGELQREVSPDYASRLTDMYAQMRGQTPQPQISASNGAQPGTQWTNDIHWATPEQRAQVGQRYAGGTPEQEWQRLSGSSAMGTALQNLQQAQPDTQRTYDVNWYTPQQSAEAGQRYAGGTPGWTSSRQPQSGNATIDYLRQQLSQVKQPTSYTPKDWQKKGATGQAMQQGLWSAQGVDPNDAMQKMQSAFPTTSAARTIRYR